jgi:hypothetical protein
MTGMRARATFLGACVLTSGLWLGAAAPAVAADPAAVPEAPPPAGPAGTLVPQPPPPDEHPYRYFSLTISPIHLTFPILELTGEARLADRFSVAGIFGVGKISDTDKATGIKIDATAVELGGHVRYYALGDFRHGMQVGAEVLYLHLADSRLVVKGEGVAIGPFIGYKYTADIGFTFDTQVGVEYVGARASSTTASASDSAWIPLLNLNVGWSF